MKAIGSPLDFVGLNIYTPPYARADDSAQGYAMEPMPTSYPHMASRGCSWGRSASTGACAMCATSGRTRCRRFTSRRMEHLRMMC